jgi:hypothetical protein
VARRAHEYNAELVEDRDTNTENAILSEDGSKRASHTNSPDSGPPTERTPWMPETDKRVLSVGLPFVLAVWAASRLLYLVCGSIFARVLPVGAFYGLTPDVPFGTLNLWSHWDGAWYVGIAGEGYGTAAPASTAFLVSWPFVA